MDKLRIDRWLWHTRFFRTRALAAKAVEAGHVRVSGRRVKASFAVGTGDVLVVEKGPLRFEVSVDAIAERRISAKEAVRCYTETPDSKAARQARQDELRASAAALGPATRGRPDKRTRRLIRSRKTTGE